MASKPGSEPLDDRKVGKVHRWNVLKSQIRHQGLGWWLLRRMRGL